MHNVQDCVLCKTVRGAHAKWPAARDRAAAQGSGITALEYGSEFSEQAVTLEY